MALSVLLLRTLSSLLLLVPVTLALERQVLGTFIYTRHGDRTPYVVNADPSLTPLGAQQLYQTGNKIRERYLSPTFGKLLDDTTIRNIGVDELVNSQMTILSADKQWVTASAQAFMQGLYPPRAQATNSSTGSASSVQKLANGTTVTAPLQGYQYPSIVTASSYDSNSIFLDGSVNCPAYTSSITEYYNTSDYQSLQASTAAFYQSLQDDYLDGVFSDASVGYFDAYYIYDYLQYAFTHNETVARNMAPTNLAKAELLATDWAAAMYANTSVSGLHSGDRIRAIAGRTLAARILQGFWSTINTKGQTNKMVLLFGDYEPMISFAALAGLRKGQYSIFEYIPDFGSSFVFELFSLQSSTDATDTASYPDASNIFVRFLYLNGTGEEAEFVEYPLFGNGPSQSTMSFTDFMSGLGKFTISGAADWCDTCGSYSVFCAAYNEQPSNSSRSSQHTTLHPALAGLIGALIALVVIALVAAVLMFVFGMRVHRQHHRRRSGLGGFKGSEKLASDQDLTVAKGGAGAVVTEAQPEPGRGHERVGSWELREATKTENEQPPNVAARMPKHRSSFDNDDAHISPYSVATTPREQV